MSCCPKNAEARSDSTVFNYKYNQLQNLTKYRCEPSCLCRWDNERSSWDRMQYNWMVKGKQPNVPPASQSFINSWKYHKN